MIVPLEYREIAPRVGLSHRITIRNEIKAEMDARELEKMIAGQYIVRYTTVLSNRFDIMAFKKVMPELYKAYTKQVSSRRFTISE